MVSCNFYYILCVSLTSLEDCFMVRLLHTGNCTHVLVASRWTPAFTLQPFCHLPCAPGLGDPLGPRLSPAACPTPTGPGLVGSGLLTVSHGLSPATSSELQAILGGPQCLHLGTKWKAHSDAPCHTPNIQLVTEALNSSVTGKRALSMC